MIIGGLFMDPNFNLLESQMRECYGRVVYSHKTHEKCADILFARNNRFKTWQIVLSVLTTTGVVATIFGDDVWVKIVSAIISALLLLLNTYLKSFDLGSLSQKHSDAAADLWNVRESYLSILADIKMQRNIEEICIRRDDLQQKLASIYKGCPRTISKAYKKARTALKFEEEMSFSDTEIDNLLPIELRKIQ